MGQKDITEKLLEDYNDVFADIINGLIFKGEQRILQESLENAKVHSQYKAEDGKVHELERDVIKYWKEKKVELAICGIENQSNVKKYMPFRIIGYDGAAYRSQLLENRKEILPVMTIVLYFGTDHHWYGKKNIKGLMKIPEGLEEYINDYEMKVFEIAWLTEEEISRFHSDFKVVANFFVQKRKHKDYIPDDPTEIRHIDEVLKLLRVMTGDERYQAIFQKERGVYSMCDVAERLEKMGMEKGIEKGIEKGMEQGMEQGVKQGRKLGRNEGIHEEKVRVYKKLLEKGFSKQEAQEITELPQFLEN
ncbi:MAG TPA: transposase [Lachnospiraceae bacterium]|jgi:SOS response regulatory protein OraA/RecX|nr:transposase [Lachnospiraceae bacterium]